MPITRWILCSLGAFLGALPSAATAQSALGTSAAPVAGVRPTTARLAALIYDATARSPTFRNLVVSLEATDGMVFVDEGKCSLGVPACLLWQLTQAGRYRVLFVVIDTGRPDVYLMRSIGHELRHALEVLGDPSVRTTAALKHFYLRGSSEVHPRIIETAAAQAAGDAVLREIQQGRSQEQTRPR